MIIKRLIRKYRNRTVKGITAMYIINLSIDLKDKRILTVKAILFIARLRYLNLAKVTVLSNATCIGFSNLVLGSVLVGRGKDSISLYRSLCVVYRPNIPFFSRIS